VSFSVGELAIAVHLPRNTAADVIFCALAECVQFAIGAVGSILNRLAETALLCWMAGCCTTADVGADEEADKEASERREIQQIQPDSEGLARCVYARDSLPARNVARLRW
jgi:hypothetical protein